GPARRAVADDPVLPGDPAAGARRLGGPVGPARRARPATPGLGAADLPGPEARGPARLVPGPRLAPLVRRLRLPARATRRWAAHARADPQRPAAGDLPPALPESRSIADTSN